MQRSLPRPFNEFYDVQDDAPPPGRALLSLREGMCVARHDYLTRPAAVLQLMGHPNIEPVFGTRQHEGKTVAVIRQPSASNLCCRLKTQQNVDRVSIALQLADAIIYLQTSTSKKAFVVVHGNIHPTNVLMHDGIPVLSNFALCSSSISADVPGVQDDGRLTYKAPELLQSQGSHGPVRTPETDVYAFGMLLYEMFAGEEPFRGVAPPIAAQRVLNGERPPRGNLLRGARGDALWTIITGCWAQQPNDRWTMARIHADLIALPASD